MDIGKFRHQIAIQVNTPTQDSAGSWIDSWADEGAVVWGSIEPLSGRELLLAQQVKSDVSHKIRIRYKAGITSAKRVRYQNRYFNIISVLNIQELNVYMEILAKEITT
jgi:SPP1 family predicted phage head-tail adaptor